MESQRSGRVSIFSANLLYMLVMLLFVSLGYIAQKWDFKYGIIITEFLLIALPTILFIKLKGASVKKELRLNKLSIVDAVLVIVIFTSGYWVAVFINMLGQIALSMMGELITPQIPFAQSASDYFVLILIIAGSAGICEEMLCRGYIMRAYEGLGMWPGIIISAVMFSLLHLNIQNTLAPLFLGLLLGFVVYRTNSLFAGILGHFTNNAISVTWGYIIMNLPIYKSMDTQAMEQGLTTTSLISAAFLFGMISLFTGAIMIISLKALGERHQKSEAETPEIKFIDIVKNFRLSWPLLITLIIFITMMVMEVVLIVRGQPLINL